MDLRIFTEPQQGASYDKILAVARAAEQGGFDAFFRSDHYLAMGGVSGLPGPTDAWITLAGLARETSRIRLGTLMSPITFRQPGPLAISVAQVDAMSGGRVELGIGAGWFGKEHAAYGIPFPERGERFERLEEQLAIITGLWTAPAGQTFSYSGEHYQVADSPALPKPVQAAYGGHPPILIGGSGPKRTPRLAARYAAEFNTAFQPPDVCSDQYDRVREACQAVGRDPSSMTMSVALVVCCGRSEGEIARRAEAIHRQVDELRENGLAGSPAEVVDKIGAYAEAGVQRLYFQVLDLDDLSHIELLATAVLPKV
ncbi:MAG TPA: LLM class F420-dependent oxidoreductase [Chloroflexota bacterium]|nr:LLM class F420-dependent oxidoreductase [Chloroflexota bacterium]